MAIRQFLNRPGWHGKAALVASVESTASLHEEELRFRRQPEVFLSISDCSSQCLLEFDLDSVDGQRNSLYKIDTLIAGLDRFRRALEEEIELFNERERTLWGEW